MAKKPKGATAESATPLTPVTALRSLMKSFESTKETLDETTLAYASEVKEAKKKKHLHTKVWGQMTQMKNYTPEKLRLYIEHHTHMFEALGYAEKAASAPDLPLDASKDEEKTEKTEKAKAEPGGGNVAKFPQAAGPSH